jgi:hypothetical protein
MLMGHPKSHITNRWTPKRCRNEFGDYDAALLKLLAKNIESWDDKERLILWSTAATEFTNIDNYKSPPVVQWFHFAYKTTQLQARGLPSKYKALDPAKYVIAAAVRRGDVVDPKGKYGGWAADWWLVSRLEFQLHSLTYSVAFYTPGFRLQGPGLLHSGD